MLRCFATVRGRFEGFRAGNFHSKDEERNNAMLARNLREGGINVSKTSLATRKGSFLKEIFFGFSIEICIENALDPRTIDLQLSLSLDFTRTKFFRPFGGIGEVKSITSSLINLTNRK